MSNLEDENPGFDELDLPAEDMSQPEDDGLQPEALDGLFDTESPDETAQSEAPGDLLEPVDDILQPAEEGLEPGHELLEPAEGGLETEPGLAELEPAEGGAEAESVVAAPGKMSIKCPSCGRECENPIPPGSFIKNILMTCVCGHHFRVRVEEGHLVEKGPGFLKKLATASPYVVLLGIALAAVLIGIFCLFMELRSYGFQIKPPQAAHVPAAQSGPPNTTATA